MPEQESGHVTIGQSKIRFSILRSKRRRRSIGLLVGREGDIQILAPARAGFAAIERLLHSHTDWINRKINRANRHRALNPPPGFEAGQTISYRGERFTLRIAENSDEPYGCMINGTEIFVNLHNAGASPEEQREEIQLEMMLWYKKQAKIIFEERVVFWSGLTRLKPRRVIVSNARRQWGSCSAGNDVRLNWRLIMASRDILDYVIIHELCHIPHKDHSRRFWRLVENYIPNCKTLRKQLHALDPGFGFSQTGE